MAPGAFSSCLPEAAESKCLKQQKQARGLVLQPDGELMRGQERSKPGREGAECTGGFQPRRSSKWLRGKKAEVAIFLQLVPSSLIHSPALSKLPGYPCQGLSPGHVSRGLIPASRARNFIYLLRLNLSPWHAAEPQTKEFYGAARAGMLRIPMSNQG